MAADETPDQPDEPRHSDPGDPCTHPWCVAVAEADANATTEERESAQRHGVSVKVLRDIRDDARPAAVAGRAGEDELRRVYGLSRHWYQEALALEAERDQARAELAEAREVCEAARRAGNARAAQLSWQRDGETARAVAAETQLAEVTRERDRWHRTHDGVLAALATANRERAEARAKVDGGEWQWGVLVTFPGGEPFEDWADDEAEARRMLGQRYLDETKQLIRRWHGPVEAVTDDGSGT